MLISDDEVFLIFCFNEEVDVEESSERDVVGVVVVEERVVFSLLSEVLLDGGVGVRPCRRAALISVALHLAYF